MASNIDPTKPSSPIAFASDQRKNWQAAKDEIEELQAGTGAVGGPFLPLTGGALSGSLIVPNGTPNEPGLEFGSNQTGFYCVTAGGGAVVLRVGGQISWTWGVAGPIIIVPFDFNTQRAINMGDPTGPTDGMNRRTADARYAPLVAAHKIERLEARVKHLEGLVDSLLASPRLEVGRGMPTTVVRR
jgi:hypothetical protein